eukprot:565320-Amphidinium_carterae.1
MQEQQKQRQLGERPRGGPKEHVISEPLRLSRTRERISNLERNYNLPIDPQLFFPWFWFSPSSVRARQERPRNRDWETKAPRTPKTQSRMGPKWIQVKCAPVQTMYRFASRGSQFNRCCVLGIPHTCQYEQRGAGFRWGWCVQKVENPLRVLNRKT